VAGTAGADFHPDLDTGAVEAVFLKGAHAAAYSGFEGADETGTPLADWLRAHDVDEVDVVGIATDYCVHATAADAARAGFGTRVLLGLTAGVAPDSTAKALEDLRTLNVSLTGTPAGAALRLRYPVESHSLPDRSVRESHSLNPELCDLGFLSGLGELFAKRRPTPGK
jgi:nicotinamidase/pyrazinamidase